MRRESSDAEDRDTEEAFFSPYPGSPDRFPSSLSFELPAPAQGSLPQFAVGKAQKEAEKG